MAHSSGLRVFGACSLGLIGVGGGLSVVPYTNTNMKLKDASSTTTALSTGGDAAYHVGLGRVVQST